MSTAKFEKEWNTEYVRNLLMKLHRFDLKYFIIILLSYKFADFSRDGDLVSFFSSSSYIFQLISLNFYRLKL